MTSRTVPLDAPQPEGLTPTENLLVDMAMEALGHSINVSTGALVAAAVITKRGQMFSGGTLTLAIPSAMCAERVAVASAHASGDLGVTAVALVRASGGPVLPCGACLQLLSDVQTYNRTLITVYSVDAVRERVEIIPLTDLLPRPFRSRKLDQAGGSASPWR